MRGDHSVHQLVIHGDSSVIDVGLGGDKPALDTNKKYYDYGKNTDSPLFQLGNSWSISNFFIFRCFRDQSHWAFSTIQLTNSGNEMPT